MTTSAFLLAVLLAAPEAARTREAFDLQFVILGLPAAAPAILTAERGTQFGETMLLTGALDAKWGTESLRSDGARLLVNGKPLSFDMAEASRPSSGLRVLASPSVSARAGENAVLKLGTTENTQYFVRDADGRFSLKQVPVTPQVQIEVTVDEQGRADTIQAGFSYRLVVLGKRARIEGVDLDVGQPSIQEESATGRLQARLGHWSLLVPKTQPASPFGFLVRVTRRP